MIKKIIQTIFNILKRQRENKESLEDTKEQELQQITVTLSEKERKTKIEEPTYSGNRRSLIICRRLFYFSESGDIRLAPFAQKKKSPQKSHKKYTRIVSTGIPNFKSANEVLDYFEKKHNVDRKKLVFFAASEKTELYYKIRKISRNGKERKLLIPSKFARQVQKIILSDILSKIEFPQEMYGFIKRRNIVQALQRHVGKDVVISLDIKDFFENTNENKVYRVFMGVLGYPHEVALFFAGLLTANTIHPYQEGVKKRVIPTGSPTSPLVANLCLVPILHKIKEKLTEVSKTKSIQIDFSIYADNIVVSYNSNGKTSQQIRKINDLIIAKLSRIFKWYGYELNHLKTKVMRKKKKVLGLVINDKINIDRSYYRKLRAQIHQIYLKGIDQADRKSIEKIRGKLNYLKFINESKFESLRKKYGSKLSELFLT